ncbi:MAG: hypothetical protein HXN47_05390 [Prevotella nanceiensis]|nr:hypothetical protein [Hoylesella nanceiensis]
MKIFEMEIEAALKGIHAELAEMNKTKHIDYEQRKYEVMKDVFTNTIVRMIVNPDDVADTFIERALEISEKAAGKFIERLKAGGEKR